MSGGAAPTERVQAVGRVVRADVARLAEQLRGDQPAWDGPSACTEWTVGDVATHMAESNDRFLAIITATLDDTPVPEFTPQQRTERQAAVKAKGRESVLDYLEGRVKAVFDRLENADAAGLARTINVPAGQMTLEAVATQRLSEVTLHGWDIRSAADRRAGLTPAAMPMLLDSILNTVGRLSGKRVPADRSLTYELDLSGEGGGPVTLTLKEGQASATRAKAEQADVTLRIPAEAAARLFWGRLDIARAIDDGTVQVEGDRAAALALNEIFKGV